MSGTREWAFQNTGHCRDFADTKFDLLGCQERQVGILVGDTDDVYAISKQSRSSGQRGLSKTKEWYYRIERQ